MKKRILPFAFFMLLFNWSFTQVIYVDSAAAGTSTGASWADAYTNLKTALNAATPGSEIWVAAGTYKPDVMNGSPTSTFLINKNLQLLGGFNGTEATASQRDPEINETILSGDLNGDDVEDDFVMNRGDNVMTVVTVTAAVTNETIVDGFTIQNGHADGATFNNGEQNGGGIFIEGSPTIRSCDFRQNYAFAGGGAIMHPPGVVQATIIDNCNFENNTASFGGAVAFAWADFNITGSTFLGNSTFNGTQNQDPDGGAVAVYVNQNSKGGVLQGCVFAGNTTASFGGGVYFFTTSSSNGAFLNLKDCTFENNVSVAGGGGAILTFRGNQPNANITDCIFSENTSETGGALILRSDAISSANFLVEDCLIDGNTATHSGGGISLNASSPNYHASISRTTITNNQSPYGGAVDQYHYFSNVPLPLGASVIFDNCLIAGNTSSNASISIGEFPNLTLFNCTVASNTGGGIELSGKSGITLQNTILANPDFPEFAALTNDVAVTSNGGNLVLDNSLNDSLTALDKPETEPDFIPGTFEPSSASPLVNGGVNDNVMAIYDLAGNPRIQNDIVDIGAYESMIIAVRQVVPGRLTLMPNPATDFLNVNLPEGLMGALEVSLYDFHGRLMKQQFAIVNQTIELGSLPPGIYTLKVVSDNQIYAGIFYKQ